MLSHWHLNTCFTQPYAICDIAVPTYRSAFADSDLLMLASQCLEILPSVRFQMISIVSVLQRPIDTTLSDSAHSVPRMAGKSDFLGSGLLLLVDDMVLNRLREWWNWISLFSGIIVTRDGFYLGLSDVVPIWCTHILRYLIIHLLHLVARAACLGHVDCTLNTQWYEKSLSINDC